jgi:peptidyl-tRNA hydrolase, PTH1 family
MQILNRLRRPIAPADAVGDFALIVGLGNPGREYAGNRHNIGFQIADRAAAAQQLAFRKVQFQALIATGRLRDRRVVIAKPQTYMNDSGRAVSALLNFYKIPRDRLLVIFDDLDLPFGTIRLRSDGGAGGHNGMRSIIAQLGDADFSRLRVGLGRPPGRIDPAAFVLQDFSRDEALELPGIIERAAQAIETFVVSDIATAMNQFNSSPLGDRRDYDH